MQVIAEKESPSSSPEDVEDEVDEGDGDEEEDDDDENQAMEMQVSFVTDEKNCAVMVKTADYEDKNNAGFDENTFKQACATLNLETMAISQEKPQQPPIDNQ